MFLSDEWPTLETLDFIIRFGSTTTFSYFDLYLCTVYAANYVYFYFSSNFLYFDLYLYTAYTAH